MPIWLAFILVVIITAVVVVIITDSVKGIRGMIRKMIVALFNKIFRRGKKSKAEKVKKSLRLRWAERRERKRRIKAHEEYILERAIYTNEYVNTKASVVAAQAKCDYIKARETSKRVK